MRHGVINEAASPLLCTYLAALVHSSGVVAQYDCGQMQFKMIVLNPHFIEGKGVHDAPCIPLRSQRIFD